MSHHRSPVQRRGLCTVLLVSCLLCVPLSSCAFVLMSLLLLQRRGVCPVTSPLTPVTHRSLLCFCSDRSLRAILSPFLSPLLFTPSSLPSPLLIPFSLSFYFFSPFSSPLPLSFLSLSPLLLNISLLSLSLFPTSLLPLSHIFLLPSSPSPSPPPPPTHRTGCLKADAAAVLRGNGRAVLGVAGRAQRHVEDGGKLPAQHVVALRQCSRSDARNAAGSAVEDDCGAAVAQCAVGSAGRSDTAAEEKERPQRTPHRG